MYRELEAFKQMDTSLLDKSTVKFLHRGERLISALIQSPQKPLCVFQEFLMFYAGTQGFLDRIAPGLEIQRFEFYLAKQPYIHLQGMFKFLDLNFLYFQK